MGHKHHRGVSLIEVMVTLLLVSIATAAAYSLFASQYKSSRSFRDSAKVQRQGGSLLALVEQRVRMAGWGVVPNMALYVKDGGSSGTDELFLSAASMITLDQMRQDLYGLAYIQSGSGGTTLSVKDGAGTTTDLDLDDDGTTDFVWGSPNYLYVITDGTTNKVAHLTAGNTGTGQLTADANLTGTYVTPAAWFGIATAGSPAVSALRYSDALSGGRQALATNVVDFQVMYRDVNGNWYGDSGCAGSGKGAGFCAMSPFDPQDIDLIRIGVVFESSESREDELGPPETRPALYNRAAGAAREQREFRVFELTVQGKNINRIVN